MRLGQHETTGKRLHRLGFVSTYEIGNSKRPLLAKVVEADGLPADEMLTHASDDLLASARLQHAAEDRPGIVEVIDLGEHQYGRSTQAYAIYERYDDNARLFLGSRARPDAATVVDILEQARAALQGFAEVTGRPHGHATLSNILIKKRSDATAPTIALTDPLPAIADPARAEQADRRALGNLLLAVVTGRSAEALRSVEVPPDRDWASVFGSAGANAARQLCHDLLFDTGTELPTADTLEQSLRERQGPINKKSIATVAAMVLLALAVGLGVMLTRPPAAPTAELGDAAKALARHPVHFRRFLQAQDPEAPNYQRLSEFLVLLSVEPWDPEANRRPPTGAGSVHEIYTQLRSADTTLKSSQLGRTSTAMEGLWRAIASTPDDAPHERWDAVARAMLAVDQDETSRNARLMFGAITTMADNFDAASRASADYGENQRARIDSIRSTLSERGFDDPIESIALLEQRIEQLDKTLFEFFAPREPITAPAANTIDAPNETGPRPGQTESPAEQSDERPSNEPGIEPTDPTRTATNPGLPDLTRIEIAELFDAALALEELTRTVEAELNRVNDIGEPVQILQAMRSDALVQFAPPAFRAPARQPLSQIASALTRDFDAALTSDLTNLLDERNTNDRWDTTVDLARRFDETARLRTAARGMIERLRSTGVVAELGWLADDESQWLTAVQGVDALGERPADQWSLADWAVFLATPRFDADPQRFAIDAWTEQLESWESALREADENNDPRYADLRTTAAESLRAPDASVHLAHWPTPERYRVVTARYDDLMQRVEVAVRLLDPCYPLRADYIETTIAELESRLSQPISGITPESEQLIREIVGTVRDRDEVRADRSATPNHPRPQCANAARFVERLETLIETLRAEQNEPRESADPALANRVTRVYLAGLRHALFADGESPTTEGWTDTLAARMFAEQPPATTNWADPESVATAVARLQDLHVQLHEAIDNWEWRDPENFEGIQATMDEINNAHAIARGSMPPIILNAALDDAWRRDRLRFARLDASKDWLCRDEPSEPYFRQAIIAGMLPDEVLTPELQGNALQDSAEFAFLWVYRRDGCPIEQLPIPESSDDLIETSQFVDAMDEALEGAPDFPELKLLPERLRNEALMAVVGFATDHMTADDWNQLTATDSEPVQARRLAFKRLGMPLDAPGADDASNPWLTHIDGMPALSHRARANWALWDAITKLSDPANADEDRARGVIDQLITRWSTIESNAPQDDSNFASRARDIAALPSRLAARPPDFTIPGTLPAGWSARNLDDRWNAIEVSIPSHGIHRFLGARAGQSRGYPTAYIAQNEISIGFMNALLAALPDAPQREILARLGEAAELNRSTLAAAGWTVRGGQIVPNDPVGRANEVDRAIDGSLSSHGWFSLLPRRDGGFATIAVRQPTLPNTAPPTADTPIHMFPGEILLELLSRIPANRPPRVPTLDEWEQLAGSLSADRHTLNLRDRAFQDALLAEVEFLGQEPDSARFISTFRIGRTSRNAAKRILPNAAARELRRHHESDNDRQALFAVVNQDGWLNPGDESTRLRHGFGNVAELVSVPSLDPPHGVVGGSALSTPNEFGERLNDPLPLRERDLGRAFTDVGFRIAIDAPGGQPYVQVALQTLRSLNFLPPAGQ